MSSPGASTAAPVALPWRTRPDHRCFGCAPGNPHGLALRFTERDGALETVLDVGHYYQSYPGVVHGGIVALVCDETMGNLIVLRHGESAVAVTTSMRLRYVGTVRVGVAHLITARITAADDSVITTSAEVTGPEGDLLATATAGYRLLPAVPLS